MSCIARKTYLRSFGPGCTATEDGYRLEISDLASKGIVLSTLQKRGARWPGG